MNRRELRSGRQNSAIAAVWMSPQMQVSDQHEECYKE